MSDLNETILQEFLADSYEGLDQLDRDLVELEKDPTHREGLDRAFRALHTIKGTCSFLGYKRLERLAHSGENLMSRIRAGERALDSDAMTALLGVVDGVRAILKSIEETRTEPAGDDAAAIEKVERVLGTVAAAPVAEVAPASAPVAPAAPESPVVAADPAAAPARTPPSPPARPAAGKPVSEDDPNRPKLFDPLVKSGRLTSDAVARAEAAQNLGDPRRIGEIMIEQGALSAQDVLDALVQHEESQGVVQRSNVRVEVALLDRIMNLVGELVLARNQVIQFVAQRDWTALGPSSQRLNHVTTRLQEEIMRTRMQPISAVWVRMPRMVRDVAAACGKEVNLEMEGTHTELDKTLIEAIKDPLTHLVRNAVDHGIEQPAIRKTLGKPAEGRLRMRAFHEGGQVNLEISDDGAGLPLERIRVKAVERRLVTAAQAAKLSDQELVRFIFLPGFSTAQRVTQVSGRGVGMDVVKSSIDRIGGTIDVQTRPGEGTTFRIRIPLTLAIIPALMVESLGERYAIPQVNLVELVPLRASTRLESVQGAEVYRLRGELLPVLHLRRQLALPEAEPGGKPGVLVVLRADGRQFGLVVDSVFDTEEIVVKPLADALRAAGVYAGATIRGDGHVALILDIAGLSRRAGMAAAGEDLKTPAAPERDQASEPVMVASLGDRWRVAVPLEQIERIEEVEADDLGGPNGAHAMQWRGQVIPILSLAARLGGEPFVWSARDRYRVLVHLGGGGPVGYVVETIEDIVEAAIHRESANEAEPAGHTIIDGRIVTLVDLDRLAPATPPEFRRSRLERAA